MLEEEVYQMKMTYYFIAINYDDDEDDDEDDDDEMVEKIRKYSNLSNTQLWYNIQII